MTPHYVIATHEAGHAVIARVLGMHGGYSKLELGPYETISGESQIIAQQCRRGEVARIRSRIIVLMAGRQAERELIGGSITQRVRALHGAGMSTDSRNIIKLGRLLADWPTWQPRLSRQTARLVRRHRETIARVAEALTKAGTLQGHEIDELVGEECRVGISN